MSGWSFLPYVGVCATGALIFLRAVALGMEEARGTLARLERQQERALRYRRQGGVDR